MSTTQAVPSIASRSEVAGTGDAAPAAPPPARRPSPVQGRALEILGHAIEYLVDSRLAGSVELSRPEVGEAILLLSRANREIFAECPEIVSVGVRVRRWLAGRPLGDAS